MNEAAFLLKEFVVLCSSFPKDHLYFRSQVQNKEGGRGQKGEAITMEAYRTILVKYAL